MYKSLKQTAVVGITALTVILVLGSTATAGLPLVDTRGRPAVIGIVMMAYPIGWCCDSRQRARMMA